VLDFAAGARQLRSLAYVGTAYVAGERTDLVLRKRTGRGPELSQHLRTDQSRGGGAGALAAGLLARRSFCGPASSWAIRAAGVTSSFKMMYWPLKIYARRLWRTVPGYPDAVLDIVPVDYRGHRCGAAGV
jgi:hypothetical protein